MSNKKKVMVTGAAGFIAPHVVKNFIQNGWDVVAVDCLETKNQLPGVEYIRGDVRELQPKQILGVDVIVHLAFVTNIPNSVRSPVVTTFDNIDMTVKLLKLATDHGVKRVVFPSTASLYGSNPIPWVESMPSDPIEPYSWQKFSCESLMKMWSSRYEIETVSLRFFQIFGENQRDDTALAAFIRSRLNNIPITLTETTAQSTFRTAQRDFVYVGDVAEAVYLASISKNVGKGEVLNVGSGIRTEMGKIAETIGGDIVFIPRRSFEVEAHQASIEATERLIGWKYRVNVLEWLKNFVEKKVNENK
jgi:UDP-glucose 4-epimerase